MIKIVVQPFVGLVLEEKVDTTGGAVHEPKPYYVIRDGYNGKEYVYDAADCLALDLPACCWAEHDAPPAERLYAAYWRSGHHSMLGKAESGPTPAPSWAELKAREAGGDPAADREILRWEETAKFALDFLPPYRPPPMTGLDFGQALAALAAGGRVCRDGWNGKGMWIARQNPDAYSKMGLPYIYMKTVQGPLVPWLASQTDVLAADWMILTGEGA